jgi:MFS transporter, ACS family, hexuronate transporter
MTGTITWTGGMLFTFLTGKSADVYGYYPLFVARAELRPSEGELLWGMMRGRK